MRLQLSVALIASGLASAGCSTPKDPTVTEPSDVAPASASTAPVRTAVDGGAPELRRCATDDDCRAVASYCAEAPCGCLALSRTDPPPQCASPNVVRCFADPCMRKGAQCQDQRCVIVKQPAAATD